MLAFVPLGAHADGSTVSASMGGLDVRNVGDVFEKFTGDPPGVPG
jgi:hypothetical protein